MRARDFLRTHPVILVPPVLYFLTCSRTIGSGDAALHIDNMLNLRLNSQVNTHPFTLLIGWLMLHLPGANVVYKANLASALLGSIAPIVFYFAVVRCFKSRWVASIATLAITACHSMWWHSTTVEVYAANAIIVACALYVFVRLLDSEQPRALPWLFFLSGLALFNHVQLGFLGVGTGATFLGYVLSRRTENKLRLFVRCAGAFVAGLVPWLLLVLHDLSGGTTLQVVLSNAFFGRFEGIMMKGAWGPALWDASVLGFIQFPSPYLAAIVVGPWFLLRRHKLTPAVVGILAFFAANTVFFMFYNTWDKFAFLLPTWYLLAFFGAFALHAAVEWSSRWLGGRARPIVIAAVTASTFALPVWLYGNLARWAESPDSVWASRYNNRYSENLLNQAEFIANPNKLAFQEFDRYARNLLAKLPQGAVYVDDDSRSYYQVALYFQRILGMRSDVSAVLLNSWGMSGWGSTPQQLAAMVVQAFDMDRPLFMPELAGPYGQFLRLAAQRRPVQFEPFQLSESSWVYRLRTKRETQRPVASKDRWDVPVIGLAGGQTTFEPRPSDVAVAINAPLSTQTMKDFGSGWQSDDQLFAAADDAGAEIDFVVDNPSASRVTLEVAFSCSYDFGDVDVRVNRKAVGRKSLYAATPEICTLTLPHVALPAGRIGLDLRVVGKSPRSSGYRFAIDTITIGRENTLEAGEGTDHEDAGPRQAISKR